jgi:hypothetical protein
MNSNTEIQVRRRFMNAHLEVDTSLNNKISSLMFVPLLLLIDSVFFDICPTITTH